MTLEANQLRANWIALGPSDRTFFAALVANLAHLGYFTNWLNASTAPAAMVA